MSATQQQQDDRIADLRVIVTELAGKIDLTNERMNNTNTRLDTLIGHLDTQAKQSLANRKWFIGTAIGSLGLFLTVVALVLKAGL